jgi:hypothetical protein
VILLCAAFACLAFAVPANAAAPDIEQVNPLGAGVGGIDLQQVGSAWHLTFPSDVYIDTDGGALTLTGSRQDTSVTTMDAYQDGVSAPVGALQYSDAYGHHHWHYLALDRYDLLPHTPSVARDGLADSLGRDQKTGFCLVQSPMPNNSTDCLWNQPGALSLTGANAETVTPAHHDVYTPAVDGQYIDVTNFLPPPGSSVDYELVQWVNADCRLADTGPAKHTWEIVIRISTASDGTPSVSTTGDRPYWTDYYDGLTPAQQCLPRETVRPQVSGAAQVGAILSSVPGSWLSRMATGVANPFGYQWRRCDASGWACVDIPGATSANYVPTAADLGHTLRARVTGQFPGTGEQTTPQDSEATAPVGAAPPVRRHVVSLTAAFRVGRRVSIGRLLRHGLRLRAHCSEACRVGLRLVGPGAIGLGRAAGRIRARGSRTFVVRLSRHGRHAARRYRRGTLTLWMHVRGRDGQQQTLSRVLRVAR